MSSSSPCTNNNNGDDLNPQNLQSSSASIVTAAVGEVSCQNPMGAKDVKIAMGDSDATVEEKQPLSDNTNPSSHSMKCDGGEMKKQKQKVYFKQKEYKIRPSLLTTLYETDSRVIYNFLVSFFILLTCGVCVRDFYRIGNPFDHFWLIWWNFVQLPQTLICWALMFASTIFFPYYGMILWAKLPSESLTVVQRIIFGCTYIGFLFSFFYYPLKFLFSFHLSCACSMIITCEITRMAMKVHSFIRENFARVLAHKRNLALNEQKMPPENSSEATMVGLPTLSQYIYFSFAPTFIYRDSYPRAEKRSWMLVGQYAIQCLITIYLLNLFFVLIVHPIFSNMDYDNKVPLGEFVFSIFQCIPVGAMAMLAIFYGLLHSWLNMFAEGMRFGDRFFYSNWWQSKNMVEYYRNWNLVVHEWLYAYVYRDFTMIFGTKWGPKVAQISVFFLSSAFHEFWFGVSLRQFYPVIFVTYFIAGGILFEVSSYVRQPQMWNTVLWFNLLIGTGTFFATYGTEWYARQYCPRVFENEFVDFVVPRIWTCMRM